MADNEKRKLMWSPSIALDSDLSVSVNSAFYNFAYCVRCSRTLCVPLSSPQHRVVNASSTTSCASSCGVSDSTRSIMCHWPCASSISFTTNL
ncbi:unnamed protein product [Sphenostylis stenocarpa]|uniref:Uncharacterized protein n=1 Tax=Sphenostylis stenocarpa TaxID=92480 RepID=A0AA86SW64_9FABA|nr:unnamed protein product [Sphenostylis stenocarpa]